MPEVYKNKKTLLTVLKQRFFHHKQGFLLAHPAGFEPATYGLEIRCVFF
jgi:hypothetical protein